MAYIPLRFPNKTLYIPLPFPLRATCPASLSYLFDHPNIFLVAQSTKLPPPPPHWEISSTLLSPSPS